MDKTTEDRINKLCEQAEKNIDSQVEYSPAQKRAYLRKIKKSRLNHPFRG